MKATPNPFIMNVLKSEGCGFDCSSYTELLQTAGLKVPFAEGSVKGSAQQMTRWLEEQQVG